MPQSSLIEWLKKPSSETRNELRDDDSPPPPPSTIPFLTLPTSSPSLPNGDSPKDPEYSSPDEMNDQQQRQSPLVTRQPAQLCPSTFLPALPHQVRLRPCTATDVSALKRLNALLLPIPYPDVFYRETLQDPTIHSLTLLAFWYEEDDSSTGHGTCRLIGAVRGRLLTSSTSTISGSKMASTTWYAQPASSLSRTAAHNQAPENNDGPMLYLSTLVLLSPYRGHGIATHLLHAVLRRAVVDHGVRYVGAHVWEANSEGRAWYLRRGFREVAREEGYYRRLSPSDAVVVRREVGVLDLVSGVWK